MILSHDVPNISLPLTSNDSNTLLIPVDLASASIDVAFKGALDKFRRIDIVINDAEYGSFAELESMNEENAAKLYFLFFSRASSVLVDGREQNLSSARSCLSSAR